MLFLVDYENTNYYGIIGAELLTKEDTIIIFHNNTQVMSKKMIKTLNSCQIETICLQNQGKNGLDFYIVATVGEYLGKNKEEEIAIISKDAGFEAIKDFCKMKYKKDICIASNICTAIYLKDKKIKTETYYKASTNQNQNIKISGLKNHIKQNIIQKENDDICKAAKISPNNHLLEEYKSVSTAFELYNKLRKIYGNVQGIAIYNNLKENGYIKKKN